MHFVVFEEITSAYLHHIALKIMLLLINNLHEKSIKEVKTDKILTEHMHYL